MASRSETECHWCGDDHGDGLTCHELERVEQEMAREEEEMERDAAEWDMEWDGPRHRRARRRTREVARVRLVRVGDRVYYAEDTEKIAAYRLVVALEKQRKEAWARREAAVALWFKVGLDIREACSPTVVPPAPRRVFPDEEAW